MSYIDQNLMTGEQVIYRGKLHWVLFVPAASVLILGLLLLAVNGTVGGIVIALAVIDLIIAYLNYTTSEFGVTNKRVMIKVGIIRRHSLETLLKKVENIRSQILRLMNDCNEVKEINGGISLKKEEAK